MTTNDSQAPQQPSPNVRARVLLRQGLRGQEVAQQLTQSGIGESEAESIVKKELASLRLNAGLFLAAGLVLAFIALVASLRSYFQYLEMRHSVGYHLFYFFPLPFLVGVVFTVVAITKLSKSRW